MITVKPSLVAKFDSILYFWPSQVCFNEYTYFLDLVLLTVLLGAWAVGSVYISGVEKHCSYSLLIAQI